MGLFNPYFIDAFHGFNIIPYAGKSRGIQYNKIAEAVIGNNDYSSFVGYIEVLFNANGEAINIMVRDE